MSNLLKNIHAFSDEHQLIAKGSTIIIGLSGGPDSVALLSLLVQLQPQYALTLIAAHLDHQWRQDSHQDLLFCQQIAQDLGVPFISAQANAITLPPDKAKKAAGSQEELGRLMRRTFLEKLAHEQQADAIALGHHYNDQQETFFIRLIRGASIAGLAGIQPKHGLYIRPLLTTTKEQLLTYLKQEGLSFRNDETNQDPTYLRNAIRHKVIPALRECDSRFDTSFRRTLTNIQETNEYLERVTTNTLNKMSSTQNGVTAINVEQFLATDSFLHHRLLVHWFIQEDVSFTPGTSFFNEVLRFIANPGREHQVGATWKLVKNNGFLSIEKVFPTS